MHKHIADYLKNSLEAYDRVVATFDRITLPELNTDYLKNSLEAYDRVVATLDRITLPELNTDYLKNSLEAYDRVVATLDRITLPELNTDYLKNSLEAYDRVVATLDRITLPELNTDYLKNSLEAYDRVVATFDRIALLELNTDYLKNSLEAYDRVVATFDKGAELPSNCVETDYNRDLAYRSTEEPNDAAEYYNEVIISNLELVKSIFGDGLAFAERNKEIPSNITIINVRQITIGQVTQGEKIEMKSKVSNSQVGVLNTGEMQAKSITGSISTSADPSQHQIAEALTSLMEAVKASQNISSQRQTEILEQLELLSEQAKLAPSKRKVGLVKPILSTLATALSAGGGSAEIWSQWGDAIKIFFGIHD